MMMMMMNVDDTAETSKR